jgi:hypothetical protein
VTSATAGDLWVCAVGGATDVRVRGSAYTSGTAAVVIQPTNTSVAGAITPPTGSSATQVQGAGAVGATAVGNPIQDGCVFNTTPATITNGQTGALQCSNIQNLLMNPRVEAGGSGSGSDGVSDSQTLGSFLDNNGSPRRIAVRNEWYNPLTPGWDRPRTVTNSTDSTGIGIGAAGLLGQLDDTSPSTCTENQFCNIRIDSKRALRVDTEGQKLTYSAAAVNFTPAATPTDVCVLPGSASKTIRVTRLMVQGFATTKGSMTLQIIKRAAADTAGTSAGLTAIPYDSADAAASAAPLKYTANPTINSTVGNYDTKSLNFAVAGDESVPYIFDSGYRGGAKALVLRGVAEQIAVNLAGGTVPTGGTVGCSFEWTEE